LVSHLKTTTEILCFFLCRSGCYTVEWHSSCNGHPWADENTVGWRETELGHGEWEIHVFSVNMLKKDLQSNC